MTFYFKSHWRDYHGLVFQLFYWPFGSATEYFKVYVSEVDSSKIGLACPVFCTSTVKTCVYYLSVNI